ncbi:MAG: hypothetical protein DBY27_01945 [Clostridiaceae bacterium]|nr:MAG: hypothetical protein DBY27_01945 [Clostridiaceae bacterium]
MYKVYSGDRKFANRQNRNMIRSLKPDISVKKKKYIAGNRIFGKKEEVHCRKPDVSVQKE